MIPTESDKSGNVSSADYPICSHMKFYFEAGFIWFRYPDKTKEISEYTHTHI